MAHSITEEEPTITIENSKGSNKRRPTLNKTKNVLDEGLQIVANDLDGIADAFEYAAYAGAGPSGAGGRYPVSEVPSIPNINSITGYETKDTVMGTKAGGRPNQNDPTKKDVVMPIPPGFDDSVTKGRQNKVCIRRLRTLPHTTNSKQYGSLEFYKHLRLEFASNFQQFK